MNTSCIDCVPYRERKKADPAQKLEKTHSQIQKLVIYTV